MINFPGPLNSGLLRGNVPEAPSNPVLQNRFFYQIALCGKDSLTGSLDNTKAMGTVGRDGRGRKGLEYLGSQRAATELGQGTWPWG